MRPLDRVVNLVTPPTGSRHSTNWATTEREIGRSIPSDYKELFEVFGPGSFDEFVWLLHPSANANLDLVRQNRKCEVLLQALRADGAMIPYDLIDDRLLAWATTDNGDVCYWHATTGPADLWHVVVNQMGSDEWTAFEMTATQFIWSVLSGNLVVATFPHDFPAVSPRFVRLQPGRS
jgi:hypothetical protein